jgi:hypothetical protein
MSLVHDGDLIMGGMDNFKLSTVIASGYPPLANETVPQCSYYDYKLPPCSRKRRSSRSFSWIHAYVGRVS